MNNKINILGVMIDKLDKKSLQTRVSKSLEENVPIKIFTPNPEMLLKAKQDEYLRDILNSAEINIADGIGVVIASKIIGTPLPCRLAGIELGEYILSLAAKEGLSVFLLGGKSGVAELAKEKLEKKYKNIRICGVHDGYFDVNGYENADIIKKIVTAEPDILFVCMGFPRQEIWISENYRKIPSLLLSVGLGGSLDVWSEKIRRAPSFFRALSLEWIWRMLLEPRRVALLPKIPLFFSFALSQRLAVRYKKYGKNAH